MNITQHELNTLLFYSFRYALGRMSYSTQEVADLLTKYKDVIAPSTKDTIMRDIDWAIEQNRAGMQMDIDLWLKFKEEFKDE